MNLINDVVALPEQIIGIIPAMIVQQVTESQQRMQTSFTDTFSSYKPCHRFEVIICQFEQRTLKTQRSNTVTGSPTTTTTPPTTISLRALSMRAVTKRKSRDWSKATTSPLCVASITWSCVKPESVILARTSPTGPNHRHEILVSLSSVLVQLVWY